MKQAELLRLTDYESNDINKPMYSSFAPDRIFKLEPRTVNGKKVKTGKNLGTGQVDDYKDKGIINSGE